MNRAAKVVILTMPGLIYLGMWVMHLEKQIAEGTQAYIEVAGYDPRDLFSGHYIQYRLVLDKQRNLCEDDRVLNCICLKSKAESETFPEPLPLLVADWNKTCASKPACSTFLKGKCQGNSFLAGVERFYIPEIYQDDLARLPEPSFIKVSLLPDGRAIARDLLIHRKSFKELNLEK
ncbi:GDYXXLXY domain-containing protein [Pseudobacteriovorax antillogorgiicola]|uniref:Uncharacterized membrane-anchored protein n=1 Tax=Pseudobacteriovorax antillogorgiicola TaxID=1513793 RepID=A0A1Y6CR14_9BACT|nr:GDYXXLXY domain-containing protein [Pseudobacteriovorax antillogorgiicola]TCS42207.1 putative membrane-anchored protein [Pseudobacteriovorax antillogorgiicola]SMF82876.1 Uncharacterized membrane-anchored protein [Pseudobacteriovorax antillogorgiicola]